MNALIRVSCVVTHEGKLTEEIYRLNSQGWYVQSGTRCNKVNEIALQCVYIGYKAKDKQEKIYLK